MLIGNNNKRIAELNKQFLDIIIKHLNEVEFNSIFGKKHKAELRITDNESGGHIYIDGEPVIHLEKTRFKYSTVFGKKETPYVLDCDRDFLYCFDDSGFGFRLDNSKVEDVCDNMQSRVNLYLKRKMWISLMDRINKKYATQLESLATSIHCEYETYASDTEIELFSDITFDKRYYQECNTRSTHTIIAHTSKFSSVDELEAWVDAEIVNRLDKIREAKEKFQEIFDARCGTIIKVGRERFYAHRDMPPAIKGVFLVFKCPYTSNVITTNISGIGGEITISGMDQFHTITGLLSIPLLG